MESGESESDECTICYNDMEPYDCVKFDCGHAFCGQCIFKHVETNIEDQNDLIECPHKCCSDIIPKSMIIKIIFENDDLLKKFERIDLLQNQNHAMCIECNAVTEKDDSTNKMHCSNCGTDYCFICKDSHYDYDDCPSERQIYEDLREVREVIGSHDSIKPCPICKIIIYKEDGCNSMKCEYCKLKFCWNCLRTNRQIENMSDEHMCDNYGTFTSDDGYDYIDGY